ncbi:MAG: DUF2868 domain-containing protein [Planctomycetota bacterium]|jgi:hypothetical protein
MTAGHASDGDTGSRTGRAPTRGSGGEPIPTFDDRLLAEAVRFHEADGAEPVHDAAAEELARDAGGSLEQRVVCRARLLDVSGALVDAMGHCVRSAATVVLVGLVLAAAGGAGAARASLGTSGDDPVNIFLVLVGLLVLQTVLLLVWLAMILVRPAALAGGSLGGLALALGQRVAGWLYKGPRHVTAIRAIGSAFSQSAVGKWTLSSISHSIWLSFNVGAIAVVVMLLSARDYTFVWETTILSERAYLPITRAVGAAPSRLGFAVPTEAQVLASRYGDGASADLGPARAASQAWAGLLVGSLMLYGMVPRALLVLLSLLLVRRATRRFRLDTDHPGYRRLQPRLMPASETLGVVEPGVAGRGLSGRRTELGAKPAPRPEGPPAVVGYEVAPPSPWPPPLHGVRWVDLGFVDDREAATRAVGELRGLDHEPKTVVIVCELTTTPDRGVRRFLEEVDGAVATAPALLLTAGQRLRQRMAADHVEMRVEDWRLLAASAGIPPRRVLELDLDHATASSLAGLEALLDGRGENGQGRPTATRHLEQAFTLIAKHAAGWPPAPRREDQVKLQVAIARLYRAEGKGWQGLLRLPSELPVKDVAAMTGQIRRSAERVVELLPGRLRSSPRWLAAGAVTGALGCVTAAMLVSPVAISALPIWSGLGAAVAAAVRLGTDMQGEPEPDEPVRPATDLDAAVRCAALFAVLLELQGGDEAWISRSLEYTFPGESDAPLRSAGDAAAWLDETRHRLDVTLAREAAA